MDMDTTTFHVPAVEEGLTRFGTSHSQWTMELADDHARLLQAIKKPMIKWIC
jgi:hypothetical protein